MDPNANLKEQLEIANRICDQTDTDSLVEDLDRLAELVVALDGWMSKGGFAPAKWNRTA